MDSARANERMSADAGFSQRFLASFKERTNLPHYLTPFIGRSAEVAEIIRLLQNEECRMLTLVGAGGMGKTRLAVQAAAQLHNEGHAVRFIDLQPVQSAGLLPATLLDAFDLPHNAQEAPKTQLFQFLSDQELFLLLDNFEHLRDAAPILTELLQAAPGVTLLVTSRIVLHLQEEWLHAVDGLRYPERSSRPGETLATDSEEPPEEYDAVQLFTACAQRVRPDFKPTSEIDGIARVCQLVEGMPLAIELAAAWTKTLSPAAIAAEIERDLEFLATPLRNVQEKHRSMEVVFRRSWQLLLPEERAVFMRLSVLRGGFDRAAAVDVAGASLPVLAALIDKSLLRWRPNGRYEIHELLRQFAEEQLAQSPEEMIRTRERHSRYFAQLLDDLHPMLVGRQQREAMARIQEEFDNVRVAWHWSIQQERLEDIQRAALSLFSFCQRQSRYAEGAEMLHAACEMASTHPPSPMRSRVMAEALTGCGWLELRLGRLEQARDAFETAGTLYADANLTPKPAMGSDPNTGLPLLAVIAGDYDRAFTLAERAWQAAAERGDRPNQTVAGYNLTSAAIAQGRYDVALHHAQETLALTKLVGSHWMMAYIYTHLGEITQHLGDLAAAKEYYRAGYAIREEFNDPEGMAVALSHLGQIALLEQDHAQARDLYEESAAIYQTIGDRGGLVQALHGLGLATHRLGQNAAARQHLQRALRVAVDAQLTPLLLSVLGGIGAFLAESGAPELGWAALEMVQRHPASEQSTRDKAQQLLAAQAAAQAADTAQRAEAPSLESLIRTIEAELAVPTFQETDIRLPTPPPVPQTDQSLIDPLSEREQEVLALIAQGLKNREIADELHVTLSTVKAHSNNIYRKLDVNNRVQAVARARELDIL